GTALSTGDINGDGFDDLVVTHIGVASLEFYLGQGNGLFASPTSTDVIDNGLDTIVVAAFGQLKVAGTSISDVVLQDVNGDKVPDILVTNDVAGDVGVLLNRTGPAESDLLFEDERSFRADGAPVTTHLSELTAAANAT